MLSGDELLQHQADRPPVVEVLLSQMELALVLLLVDAWVELVRVKGYLMVGLELLVDLSSDHQVQFSVLKVSEAFDGDLLELP